MSVRADPFALLGEILGPDIVRDAMRRVRMVQVLERKRSAWIGTALAECVAAYEARFGVLPSALWQDFECLAPRSLAFVRFLIGRSEDPNDFETAFTQLTQTFVEGRAEGARRVLLALLERRFGPLDSLHALAVQTATGAELDRSFERLNGALSALDVVGPLLPSDA